MGEEHRIDRQIHAPHLVAAARELCDLVDIYLHEGEPRFREQVTWSGLLASVTRLRAELPPKPAEPDPATHPARERRSQ